MKEEARIKINDNEMCIKGIDEVPMFSWNTKTKEFYVLGHKFDGVNSIEDFINYIHNLDKENKSLQSQLKEKEDNWNKLKQDIGYELLKLREPNEYNNGLVNGINYVLNTMQELEILSKGENDEILK